MPCQKETLRTNYEVNLRKPITLIYIYNWEIKAKISDFPQILVIQREYMAKTDFFLHL